jgi:hypothetical protein
VALQSGLGLIVLAVLAYALSEDRTAVPFRDHLIPNLDDTDP